MFDNYYHEVHPHKTVFDTHRIWCAKMPVIADLFPDAKVIACVRHAPWVIDSIERLVRKNKFEPSGIFNYDPTGTVYSRCEGLSAGVGLVGFAWNALKEAYYGDESDRLMLLTYETLTREPQKAMEAVYDFVGAPAFIHDFDNVEYSADEFDARLGTPGLHRVGRKVEHAERRTVLPPDLFRRYENDSFWQDPKLNTRGVRIV
jgi:sulfotransferase